MVVVGKNDMKPEQLGPYRIIRRLGRGGMGTVYEGINLDTNEAAAVKVVSLGLGQDEDFRHRFASEIETLRKLKHPHIVRLFGFGQQQEQLYYVMELVDGISLDEEIQRGRRFDWREVIRIGCQTCQALRHAHDRGVIHRDIKPANLLLAGDGAVKLADFGIARLFGHTGMTSAGSVIGTVEYMAPEQADARPVDHRTDLYSLGAVLYTLLAGRPPFVAKTLPAMLHKQRYAKPDPLGRHAPDAPEALVALVHQLLAKDPAKRVPNAMLLDRRLNTILLAMSPDAESEETGEEKTGEDEHHADFALKQASQGDPEQLAVTRDLDEGDEAGPPQLPVTQDAPVADDDMPETRATDAFGPLAPSAEPSLPASDGAEPAEEPPPDDAPDGALDDAFTLVHPDELDQADTQPVERPALISAQTWVLAVGLIAVGLTVWYFLQPPSVDKLYKRIMATTADGTTASSLRAQNDIEEFLTLYADDIRCNSLRKIELEIKLHKLERKFDLRVKGLAGTKKLLPIERAYLEAKKHVWLNPELGMTKLQALIDLYGPRADESGPTGQCLELARRRVEQIQEELDRHADNHLAMIQERLDRAEKLLDTDPQRARALCRAVVELYADKPWATEAVARARAMLDMQPK